jgi:hypothetical protein
VQTAYQTAHHSLRPLKIKEKKQKGTRKGRGQKRRDCIWERGEKWRRKAVERRRGYSKPGGNRSQRPLPPSKIFSVIPTTSPLHAYIRVVFFIDLVRGTQKKGPERGLVLRLQGPLGLGFLNGHSGMYFETFVNRRKSKDKDTRSRQLLCRILE